MNKSGLSLVVTTLILVTLVFVAIGIIWAAVSNLLNENLEESEACFNIIDKVSINELYTCYNYTTTINKLEFAIEIGDVEVDEVMVSVGNSQNSKSFKIKNEESLVQYVTNYSGGSMVKLPGKNEGRTYFFDAEAAGFTDKIENIKIAPVVGGYQCDISSTLDTIDDCMSLISS